MTVDIKYNFDQAADYTFNPALIEVTGGVARLKLANLTGEIFNQDFATDTGFTYDNSKAEFSGGLVQQVSQVPDNANFGATWSQTINGSWGNSPLVPTSTKNNPQISGGKLDLVADKNVVYDATGSINPNKGAIKLKFTPDYNLVPGSVQQLFYYEEPGSANNRLYAQIGTTGAIRMYVFNSAGVSLGLILLAIGWTLFQARIMK
jgi:hypothetical protein